MQTPGRNQTIVFLAILTLFTVISYSVTALMDNKNVVSLIIMWVPGVSAIIASVITKTHLKHLGWKLKFKWLAIAWLIPIIYATIAYVLIWILGIGGVPNPTFLERAKFTLGMDSDSNLLIIVSAFFFITIINLIPALVLSLGEELGWRGFLVPELSKWLGFKKASWISGIIWGLWHLPGFLLGNYNQTGTPMIFQLVCFMLMVVATGIMMAWLRMKSGSIWPVAIFHAVHNGVIQQFYDRLTFDTGITGYFTGEFGIALVPVTILMALYFYKRFDNMISSETKL